MVTCSDQHTPFASLENPVIRPRRGQIGVRDAALFEKDGVIHCVYSALYWSGDRRVSTLEHRKTIDLQSWSEPTPVGLPTMWSPGNIVEVDGRFVMVCQHQAVTLPSVARPQGATRHDARLWLVWSDDLVHWRDPQAVMPEGCTAAWSPDSRRQIDGCLVAHDGRYWILCKQGDPSVGRIGLLVSDDLRSWRQACDHPVIGPETIGSPRGCENPCVVRDGDEYVCFVVPYDGPLAMLRSRDLVCWYGLQELELPYRPWMQKKHNAPAVIDTRHLNGKWIMLFESGSASVSMSGRLGLAWSDNLINWEVNE